MNRFPMSEQRPNNGESIRNLIARRWAAITAPVRIMPGSETPSPTRRRWRESLAALLIVAVASAIRAGFFADLGRGIPYLTYYPAIALAALYGGFLSGLLATVVSAWLCFFWIQQGYMSQVESMALAVFVIGNTIVAGVAEAMHRASKRVRRADEQLKWERRLTSAIVESSDDAIVAESLDGVVTNWNQGAQRMFGYTAEEMRGQSMDRTIPPEGRSAMEKARDGILRGESIRHFETERLRKDGSRIDVSISISPIRDPQGRIIGTSRIARDITARRRAERELKAAEEQFRGLVEQPIAGIYIIQDGKFAYVNARVAEIFGYGSHEEILGRDALSGVAEKDRSMVAEKMAERIKGEVVSGNYEFTGLRQDGSTVEIAVHGAHATYKGRPAVIGLMQDITAKVRAGEEIAQYVEQLKAAFRSTVAVITTLSEMRDPYTAGHEQRVAQLAVQLGVELGMDSHQQEGLRIAASMHDIGKITVPAEILSKPGKLSPLEYKLIQGHAQAGYDVLKGATFPWPVAEIVLQHHERMDGSGYPQGLKGEAILREARILAVADVVEAMSSHRPYRAGLGIDHALAEIEKGKGNKFDPEVVDACLKIFRQDGFAFQTG